MQSVPINVLKNSTFTSMHKAPHTAARARVAKVKFVDVIRCWATTGKKKHVRAFIPSIKQGLCCSVYPTLSFNCSLFVLR
jgi:hypothetical protein